MILPVFCVLVKQVTAGRACKAGAFEQCRGPGVEGSKGERKALWPSGSRYTSIQILYGQAICLVDHQTVVHAGTSISTLVFKGLEHSIIPALGCLVKLAFLSDSVDLQG